MTPFVVRPLLALTFVLSALSAAGAQDQSCAAKFPPDPECIAPSSAPSYPHLSTPIEDCTSSKDVLRLRGCSFILEHGADSTENLATARLNLGIVNLRGGPDPNNEQIADLRRADPELDAALEKQAELGRREAELNRKMDALRAERNRLRAPIRLLKEIAAFSAPASAQGSACTHACRRLLPDICTEPDQLQQELDVRLLERAEARRAYEATPLAAELAQLMPQKEDLREEYSHLATELEGRGDSEAPRGGEGDAALETSDTARRLDGVKAKLDRLQTLEERAREETRVFAVTGLELGCREEFDLLKETGGKSVDELVAEVDAAENEIEALEVEKAEVRAKVRAAFRETSLMLRKPGLDKAIGLFDALIDGDPEHAVAHYYRGQAYLNKEEADRALQDFDDAMRLGVGKSERLHIHEMRADRYLEDGRIDAAIAELDAAIVLDASAVLHHMRARAYLEKGDAERAIADFDSAIVEGGETPVALTARANRQEAVEALRAAGKPVPPPPSLDEPESGTRQAARAGVAESGEQGEGAQQQVEGEQQQAALEQPKIAVEPPRPEPWPKARIDEVLSAANELLTEKKYEEIVATLEPLIERNPDTAVAWVIRGRANLELESYDRSISDLGRALDLLPDHVVVLSLRAQAYERSAQNRAAIEDLTRIIDSGSDDWAIWFRRGLAYTALKDNGNAIGDFHEAFNIVADGKVDQGTARQAEYNIRVERSLAFFAMKMFAEAIDDLNVAIGMQPESARLYYLRGNSLAYAGDLDAAMDDALEALRLAPDYTLAQQLRDGIESVRSKAN